MFERVLAGLEPSAPVSLKSIIAEAATSVTPAVEVTQPAAVDREEGEVVESAPVVVEQALPQRAGRKARRTDD